MPHKKVLIDHIFEMTVQVKQGGYLFDSRPHRCEKTLMCGIWMRRASTSSVI